MSHCVQSKEVHSSIHQLVPIASGPLLGNGGFVEEGSASPQGPHKLVGQSCRESKGAVTKMETKILPDFASLVRTGE